MADVATLSSKFQISIPKSVRSAQGWKPGQRLAFLPRGSTVVLVPVRDPLDLRGIAEGADTTFERDRDDRY
ncbi:MAG TPA: AbrB/MazE/SpoVT family DNA-binding domain-containing protein [Caulobacteraceae bacterium]|nr:AbrB/MazE/SpoVT family DNA-binding domain-containing protein [Caulobacteraceae bacterium]